MIHHAKGIFLLASHTKLGEIISRGNTRLAADMLAPIRAPLANHDTTAPPTNIPRLAAPAAVPGLVLGLKGAVGEWTLGQRVARRRRVWDGLLGRVAAGAAVREADWTVAYVR